MTLLPTLTYVAPLATFGTLAITIFNARYGARMARRDRLASAWARFEASSNYDKVDAALSAEPTDLLHRAPVRALALSALSALEGIARATSASSADWKTVLAPEEFGRIARLVAHCQALIQLVRRTTIPVDVTCWHGRRCAAFSQLLMIFNGLHQM